MANTFLTPDIIASTALANLYENTVMAQLVYRDYDSEFVKNVGDTITVRKPTTFTAQEFNRTTGITVQNAAETGIPVVLNHFADVSFAVTSEDLALNIVDFNTQLLQPAMIAITQKIEHDLLLLRDDIVATYLDGIPAVGDTPPAWNTPEAIVWANKVLDDANVPDTERSLVLGNGFKANLLTLPLFQQANRSGSTAALRQGSIGNNLFGFDVFNARAIKGPTGTPASGEPNTEIAVGFHKTGLALVTRPLMLPKGAVNASVQSYQGFGLRVVMDYDISKKQDIVSIDTLYGTKVMDANRAVLINGTAA